MLGAIQCLEQADGKGFLRSYPRARISALKAQGLSSSNCTHHALEGHDDIHDRVPSADGEASSTPCSRRRPRLTRLTMDEGSGRVQRGDGDGGEEGRDTGQERFDRAGRGQVEEKPVLVLFALRRHVQEREAHGGRLGRGQGRVGQRVRAESRVADSGGARQEEPHGVGQERRRRGPVAVEVALACRDLVCAMPPRAVEVCIHLWGGRGRSGRHDQAWLVPRRHACSCDQHAPRLGPGRRAIAERLRQAGAGGGPGARAGCQGEARLVEAAGLLPDRGRLAEPHRLTSPTADAIGLAPMGQHLDDLGGGAMTVAAHQEMGLGPVAPQRGQEPDSEHRLLGASGTLSWPEAGGHQGV
jgi:hypothetical protein